MNKANSATKTGQDIRLASEKNLPNGNKAENTVAETLLPKKSKRQKNRLTLKNTHKKKLFFSLVKRRNMRPLSRCTTGRTLSSRIKKRNKPKKNSKKTRLPKNYWFPSPSKHTHMRTIFFSQYEDTKPI